MEATYKKWWEELSENVAEFANATPKQLKSFGWIMAIAFAIIGFWPWIFRGQSIRIWAIALLAIFGLAAAFKESCLKLPYRVWMFLGGFLGHINSRIILTLVYFFLITPLAILLRLVGKDILKQKLDRKAISYRVYPQRAEKPSAAETMKRQY